MLIHPPPSIIAAPVFIPNYLSFSFATINKTQSINPAQNTENWCLDLNCIQFSMASPNQEAIETFMSITGASEAIAVQKLEEHGGDLNAAVNSHFNEGDRVTSVNVHETSVAAQNDFMDIDDPVQPGAWGPPQSLLSATRHANPFSLIDPNFRRAIFDSGADFINRAPTVTHPREVREIPIEVKDGSQGSGHSAHAPVIEDVTESAHTHGSDIRGTVIIDDEDEVPATPPGDILRDELQDCNNDIEEAMVRAAIEASKREVEESYPNQKFEEHSDLNHLGPQERQPHLEDGELAHVASLSPKTAEQEKSLHEQEKSSAASESGASESAAEVELVKLKSAEGSKFRLEAGSSFIHDDVQDSDEQPLVRHRSRCTSSASADSAKGVGIIEDTPPSSPIQPDSGNNLQQNGGAFPSDEWGGISSEEHDEAVMLEAAMFGGVPEGTGYHFPYAPHLFRQSERPYQLPELRPPSPSLAAQRLIREQQDDEYLASLQADREKELKAKEEAEALCEEERRKDKESRRELEEELELERQLAAKEATLSQEPPADDENAVTLLVRMPDGSRRGRRFLKFDKLQLLFDFIDVGRGVKPGSYRVVRPYPRRAFSDSESGMSLSELGLTSKQEALYLELI